MTHKERAKKIRAGNISMLCGLGIILMGIAMIAMDTTGVGAVFTGVGAVFVATGAAKRKAADKTTDEKDA